MGEAKRRRLAGLRSRPVRPDSKTLDAFLGCWRAGMRGLPPGHCIAGSRIAAEVLQTLGYKVEPMSVWCEVERLDNPAVVIGVSPEILARGGVPNIMPLPPEYPEMAGFWGHVVLRVEGDGGPWVVDVTVGDYRSPQDGIAMPPVFAGRWTEAVPGYREVRTQLLAPSTGCAVTYWRRIDDDGGWRITWEQIELPPNLDAFTEDVRKWAAR